MFGLDGPGIESRRGRDFPSFQTGPQTHPASCIMGTGSFPGVKCGRGVLLTTHPLLAPRSWKGRAIPLPPLGHNRACNGVTLLYVVTVYMQPLVSSLSVGDCPVHRLRKNSSFLTGAPIKKEQFFLNRFTGQSPAESDDIRCCIDTIRPPEDEQRTARKM